MVKSKTQYPERNGKKWSYCYQSDPTKCAVHYHSDLNGLNVNLEGLKQNNPELFNILTTDNNPMDVFDTVTPEGTHVSVIASPEAFQKAIEDNLIFRTRHPEYPYSIYKYSQACTYSASWNEVTTASRGLILHDETGEIIARPFPKFFNYSEGKTPEHLMVGDIHVTEKLDGSLGISFINPQGDLEITTAGGFQAEQATHATEIYNERYKGNWEPREGYTYLWEIIYPENRIVVDYGDEDDIYLLGAVEIATGKSLTVDDIPEWKWKKATTYDGFEAMEKVVNAPDRENREGFIVTFKETGAKIKIKHENYVRLHRIMTGVSERSIHSLLASGGKSKLDEVKQTAPEEFTDFINKTIDKLEAQYDNEAKRITKAYDELVKGLPADVDQKDFALAVQKNVPKELSSHMFSIRSGRGLNEKKIWDSIEPPFERSFWSANNGRTGDE